MLRNRLLICLSLVLPSAGLPAAAGEVYRWTDEAGGLHLGNVPPAGAQPSLIYREAAGDRIFEWRDETGLVHFGDTPPEGSAKPTEIPIERSPERLTDPDEYSIIRQAERMAEDRRRLAEDRILRERMRVERSRLERDKAVLRMQEQLRTRGYGPRPEAWPYSYEYD